MKMKAYLAVSTLVFTLVALLHVLRLAQAWPVQLGPASIPLWVSWPGLAVSGVLALWGFSLLRR